MRAAKWTGSGGASMAAVSAPISTQRERAGPQPRYGGAKKGGAQPTEGEALGRSRGGLTTKLHLVSEGHGRPLAVTLTAGQRHESTQLAPLLDRIRVPRYQPDGRPRRGRPRKRPRRLLGDKGYSYRKCRQELRRRGIPHLIPERRDQREQRRRQGRRGGRPCRFVAAEYQERNRVERAVNRLKNWRRIATRYDKRAENYLAFVLIGCIMLWL